MHVEICLHTLGEPASVVGCRVTDGWSADLRWGLGNTVVLFVQSPEELIDLADRLRAEGERQLALHHQEQLRQSASGLLDRFMRGEPEPDAVAVSSTESRDSVRFFKEQD